MHGVGNPGTRKHPGQKQSYTKERDHLSLAHIYKRLRLFTHDMRAAARAECASEMLPAYFALDFQVHGVRHVHTIGV
jgi:hypothetical protein